MKKGLKNIVLTLVILLCIGGTIFTMYYAKNNISIAKMDSSSIGQMNNDGGGSEPPEKPTSENENKNEGNTIPEKPSGESNEKSDSTPPDKPGDDNTTSDSTPPDKPAGEENKNMINSNEDMQMPDMENMQMMSDVNISSASLTWIYYLVFSILSIVMTSSILYLIMSKFNSKNFKETFINADKVMIFLLAIIILSSALVIADKYITEKFFITNNASNVNQSNMMNNSTSASYSSVYEIVENKSISDNKYESTNSDENAILASGDIEVTMEDITVSKSGDSQSGDDANFYGINSAIIAKDGANLTINNSTIKTTAKGANGVFSYGGSATTNNDSSDGTTITIKDSTITTTGDNAGGIMTTGGGITVAKNLKITTSGTSSAAIRTDRGGGTVTVTGGTYTTSGVGSPAVYSTADINVSDAKLISSASEGIIIEGKNSVTLESVTLEDSNTKLNGMSTTYKNIFLYQSTSGDASDGTSVFTSKNSSITTNKGDTFYITNTSAKIVLENNTFTNNDNSGYFLRVQKDSWGNEGSNGGDVIATLKNENIKGNIYVDNISSLDITFTSSSYEGSINKDNNAKNISLTLDKDSSITLTSDSYVTTFSNLDSKNSNINFNGYKLYVNGKAIN